MDTSKFVSFSKQYFEGIRNNPWVIFNNQEAFQYYTPLGDYPHGYVLACLMDRQVKAETAWSVPYNMAKALGKFDMKTLASVSEVEMKELFAEHSHHRRPNLMADIFFQAVQRIAQEYDGDARRMWNDRPDSKTVAAINLPEILKQGRGAVERYIYTAQGFLDRAYDYRLDFILVGDKWEYLSLGIHTLPWTQRFQNVELN